MAYTDFLALGKLRADNAELRARINNMGIHIERVERERDAALTEISRMRGSMTDALTELGQWADTKTALLGAAGVILDQHRHVAECGLPAGHCEWCEAFEQAATFLERARIR